MTTHTISKQHSGGAMNVLVCDRFFSSVRPSSIPETPGLQANRKGIGKRLIGGQPSILLQPWSSLHSLSDRGQDKFANHSLFEHFQCIFG
jgi:hypothetical protein